LDNESGGGSSSVGLVVRADLVALRFATVNVPSLANVLVPDRPAVARERVACLSRIV
jgi:hypothetical protein